MKDTLITIANRSGQGRFFVVTHDPKVKSKPVRVELRQTQIAGRCIVSMSRLLAHDNCVADEATIIQTAEEIEARVGKIDQLEGIYA